MARTKKPPAKKNKKSGRLSSISYSQKRAFIRQFDTVSNKKLTPGQKGAITRQYNKLKALEKLPFLKADKAVINQYDKAGAITTKKGFFYPTSDKNVRVRKDGLISARVKDRTSYFIPMSEADIAEFLNDTETFLAQLKKTHAAIFKKHKGERFFIRLIFPNALGVENFTLESLEYYIQHMPDIIDTRTNKVLKTGKQRRKEILKRLIGLVLLFYKRGGKEGRPLPKRGNKRGGKKAKNSGRRHRN